MSRQGTYVTSPGGSANWAAGIADSLSNLSRSYLDQGAAEDERARLAAADAESKRRWALDREYKLDTAAESKRRWDTEQDRIVEADKLVEDKKQWIKDKTEAINLGDLRAREAEKLGARAALDAGYGYGIADDDSAVADDRFFNEADKAAYLKSEADARKLAASAPVYKEDVAAKLSADYIKEFGTALDISLLAPVLDKLPSAAKMQEVADATAKARTEADKEQYEARLNAYKLLLPSKTSGTSSTPSSSSSKSYPKTFSQILPSKEAKGFEGASWWYPDFLSDHSEARAAGKSLLATLEASGFTVPEAVEAFKSYMESQRTGDTSNEFSGDHEVGMDAAYKAIAEYRALPSGSKNLNSEQQTAKKIVSALGARGIKHYTPTNIRAAGQSEFDKLLGQVSGDTTSTASNGKSVAAADDSIENIISKNLGYGDKVKTDQDAAVAVAEQQVKDQLKGVAEVKVQSPNTVSPISRSDALKLMTTDEVYTGKTTPTSSLAAKNSYLDNMQGLLNTAYDNGNTDRANTLIGKMTDLQTNIRQAERYKTGTDFADKVNEFYGEDVVSNDTVFVLPYDNHGNDRSWNEIVKDINTRPSINYLMDGINEETTKAASNNPQMQKELIDKANRLIANDSLFRSFQQEIAEDVGIAFDRTILQPIMDFASSLAPYDPTSDKHALTGADRIQQGMDYVEGQQMLEDIQGYLREHGGTGAVDVGQPAYVEAASSLGRYSEDSPVTDTVLTAATALPAAKVVSKAAPAVGYAHGLAAKTGKNLLDAGTKAVSNARLNAQVKAAGKSAEKILRETKPKGLDPKTSKPDLNIIRSVINASKAKADKAAKVVEQQLVTHIDRVIKSPKSLDILDNKALEYIIVNPKKYPNWVVNKAEDLFSKRVFNQGPSTILKPKPGASRLPKPENIVDDYFSGTLGKPPIK